MNRIWNIWRMNTSELIWSLIIMLGGTAFGMIIMSITLMLGEESYLVIGSFVALIVLVMVFIFLVLLALSGHLVWLLLWAEQEKK